MLEPQEIEKQKVTTPGKVKGRLYETQGKTRTQWKKIADKTADVVITTGGVAIILSVLAILFVIMAESFPLWKDPVAEQLPTVNLKQIEAAASQPLVETSTTTAANLENLLAFGVDEYQSIAYTVTSAGMLTLFSLTDNSILQRYQIKGLDGGQATAAFDDNLHHIVVVGSSTGTAIPITIVFSAKFEGGKQIVTPSIKEGKPIQIDPAGRAITKLVYTMEEGKVSAAALLDPRTLLFYARRETTSLLGEGSAEEYRADLSPMLKADVTAFTLDKFQEHLLVGTATGDILHWQIDKPENLKFINTFAATQSDQVGISALGWVLGDRSLIVGDTAGGVSVWFQVRTSPTSSEAPFARFISLNLTLRR